MGCSSCRDTGEDGVDLREIVVELEKVGDVGGSRCCKVRDGEDNEEVQDGGG